MELAIALVGIGGAVLTAALTNWLNHRKALALVRHQDAVDEARHWRGRRTDAYTSLQELLFSATAEAARASERLVNGEMEGSDAQAETEAYEAIMHAALARTTWIRMLTDDPELNRLCRTGPTPDSVSDDPADVFGAVAATIPDAIADISARLDDLAGERPGQRDKKDLDLAMSLANMFRLIDEFGVAAAFDLGTYGSQPG